MSLLSETDAIIAAINTQFSTARAVRPDQASTQPGDHIVVFVSRRYVADQLLSGEVTVPGGRVVTRYLGKSESGVSNSQAKTRAALEDQILASGIGPFEFETEDPIQDDTGDWFSAADVWTY